MEKDRLIEKTVEVLRPFETANLVDAVHTMSIKDIFSHPLVLMFCVLVFFYGVVRRSKPVLLSLFSIICIAMIVRYAMPAEGDDLSLSSTLSFIGGGLLVGGVIVYFSLVKSD